MIRKNEGKILKKTAALFMLVLLTFALAACGGGSTSGSTSGGSSVDTESLELLTELDGYKIYSTGYSESGNSESRNVGLVIENESENEYELYFTDGSVNGYMMEFDVYANYADETMTFGSEVHPAPGSGPATCELILNDYELEKAGIDTVAIIKFTPELRDPETWTTIAMGDEQTVVVQEGYTQADDESGALICDRDGIKVYLRESSFEDAISPMMDALVINDSDSNVFIQTQFCYVDGEEQDMVFYAVDVPAGMRSVDDFSLSEEFDSMPSEMEISLRVSDSIIGEAGIKRFVTPLVTVDLSDFTILGEREVELSPYDGNYAEEVAGRGTINIREYMTGKYNVDVSWASSAFETYGWAMAAEDDGNGGIVYHDGYSWIQSFDEDGIENYDDLYYDGTGRFYFDEDGKLVWESDKGDVAEDSRFVSMN